MSRLSPLTVEELSPEQRKVLDAISSGPRGAMGLVGPFGVYVRAPAVGDAAQALGAAVRYATALPENLKEVAICVVGHFYRAKFEFAAHAKLARQAGVDAEVVEAIRCGEPPAFGAEDERLVFDIATALCHRHRIDDDLYALAREKLGETQLIELVTVIGYYGLVALTLNAFEVPLLEGMEDPFPEGG